MRRVSNEFIWVTVLATVCGIGLASLLSGTGLPLLLIGVVLAIGAGATTWRSRHHHRHPLPKPGPGRLRRRQRERTSEPLAPKAPPPQSATAKPLSAQRVSRRTGARSESLGAPPKRNEKRKG